ncbi:MAG TPA: ATP-binding protein, partial [Acidimicrobiales bacterium]|nr:ATP-binding protein [Acidimicrobiales bacterium]
VRSGRWKAGTGCSAVLDTSRPWWSRQFELGLGLGMPVLPVELLVQALDKASQGLIVCNREGEVVFRNTLVRALAEAPGGDVLAVEAVTTALRQALRGSSYDETVEFESPTRRTLEIRSYPLGEPGSPAGAVVLVDDISELRRLEAIRRDFVANLSHELKTPLGALSLLAETLDAEEDPEVVSRLTARVGAEATRFARIVEDLLDLSRIESGGMGQLVPASIASLVDEAVENFWEPAASRGIELRVAPVDDDLYWLASRRDVVSAIANLVDNAIKYSEQGGAVDLIVQAQEEGRACLIVRDEGIGIPEREQQRIFERFYRVDRARSRSTGGTGLGLAIVRHVAAYHGGEVSVQSVEGEGSVFTLCLPLAARPTISAGSTVQLRPQGASRQKGDSLKTAVRVTAQTGTFHG